MRGKNEQRKTGKQEKKKDLRRMVILTCVCVLMLGSATYAWFSVSNTPRVENLALVAGTMGNLKISDTVNGTYGDVIDLQNAASAGNMSSVVLNPSTTTDGITFRAPVYTENEVSGTTGITDADLKAKYIYEKEFYLKAEVESTGTASRTFDIFLLGNSSKGGTYISNKTAGTDNAASAIRISLTTADGTVIYEPNADKHITGESAVNGLEASYGGYGTLKQNSDKSFVGGTDNHSAKLFTIAANTPVKVTMRVWLEGTDADCVNEITLNNIIGQIQFISEETAP